MSALSPKKIQARHRKINPIGAKLSKGTIVGRGVYGREQPKPIQSAEPTFMAPGAQQQMPNEPRQKEQ